MTVVKSAEPTQQLAVVFTSLWGLVHVVHFLRHGSGIDPTGIGLLGFAIAVFIFPSRWYLLVSLCLVHVLTVIDARLFIPNHSMIMLFVNLCLLVGMAFRYSVKNLLPTIRMIVLMAYGAAAISKLNRGFFDPMVSCTTDFYGYLQRLASNWIGINLSAPDWLLAILPLAIASAELLVPLLLLTPRLRHAGVALLVPLHLSMSLNPLAPGATFTVLVLGVGLLFLSPEAQSRFVALADRTSGGAVSVPRRRLVWLGGLSLLMAWALPSLGFFGHHLSDTLLTNLITLVLGGLLLIAILQVRLRSAPLDWRIAYPCIPLLLLLALNIVSPYMGGRTLTTFTMYSNLQTELGKSNHFFIPRLPVLTGQDDLVRVLESSNPALYGAEQTGHLLAWHELRRHTATFPDDYVVYERGGVVFTYSATSPQPELGTTHPIWHFLIHYRPFSPDSPVCLW